MDYRELLKKYMALVLSEESITYLEYVPSLGEGPLSAEDVAELRIIDNEVVRDSFWDKDRKADTQADRPRSTFPDERDLMHRALLDAGYTPIPNEPPEEYTTPEWLREALERHARDTLT